MPPFPQPSFSYEYDVDVQIAALREWEATKEGRDIPARSANNLLLATWNIANLGVQDRRDKDYRLIAEILGWFDVVAIQEVNDNRQGIAAVHQLMDQRYRLLFSDPGGNKERMAFVFDATKMTLLDEVGEVAALSPSDYRNVKLLGIRRRSTASIATRTSRASGRTPSRSRS